MEKEVVELDG
jgi:hypothetical protein